jgi:hypothetical protein
MSKQTNTLSSSRILLVIIVVAILNLVGVALFLLVNFERPLLLLQQLHLRQNETSLTLTAMYKNDNMYNLKIKSCRIRVRVFIPRLKLRILTFLSLQLWTASNPPLLYGQASGAVVQVKAQTTPLVSLDGDFAQDEDGIEGMDMVFARCSKNDGNSNIVTTFQARITLDAYVTTYSYETTDKVTLACSVLKDLVEEEDPE